MTITGYDQKPVPTRLHNTESPSLAVLYPGRGYFLDAPLFFYLVPQLESLGVDSLGIDLRYAQNEDFQTAPEAVQKDWVAYDSEAIAAALEPVVSRRRTTVYVGKSLGTVILKNQVLQGSVPADALLVFLTPAFPLLEFYQFLLTLPHRSLLVYGTNDPYYQSGYAGKIATTERVTVLELRDAGHAFEVEGDVPRSIENLKTVLEGIEVFLKKPLA